MPERNIEHVSWYPDPYAFSCDLTSMCNSGSRVRFYTNNTAQARTTEQTIRHSSFTQISSMLSLSDVRKSFFNDTVHSGLEILYSS